MEELKLDIIRTFAEIVEDIESAKKRILAKINNHYKDESHTSSTQTNMKLEFRNWFARRILTGEEIKGEGGVPIEVALVDDLAGNAVDADRREASANIEIVLLKAKPDASVWTSEEFNSNIVCEVEGKQPILNGNVTLPLQGVVAVKNIKIRHCVSKIRPPEFMLGARVVGGDCRVKEARTDPFVLKNYRVGYSDKYQNPSLLDDVWRLDLIGKEGKIHKRLKEKNIYTVEDFLIQLLINPQGLKNIAKPQERKWKTTVKNARACRIGKRVYCYMDLRQKTSVTFSILGEVLGLCYGIYYSPTSTLSREDKAKANELLESACKNWEQVMAFDDQESLQQHLAGHIESIGISELLGESSSIDSSIPSRAFYSTTNMFGETGACSLLDSVLEPSASGDRHDASYNVEAPLVQPSIVEDDLLQGVMVGDLSITGSSMNILGESGADDSFIEGLKSMQHDDDGLMEEPNADERRKRWKKPICVAFRKRVRVPFHVSSPKEKKQKVG